MVGTFEAIVAVKELRSRLMIENFLVSIQEFSETEEFTSIGRSCLQIFVQLIRDGQSTWSTKRPTFDEVNRHLDKKLCKWDYNAYSGSYYVDYEFDIIFEWLEIGSTCQHFALWMIANITRQNNSK